jgi:molecular chaperone DnaK (HSP70)
MSAPSEPTLVVDVGSAASSAALVTHDRAHLLAEPASGGYRWPSAVYWDGRQMLVGTLAVDRRRADPGGYGDDFKRGLGTAAPVLLGGHRFRPVEQVAALLTALRFEAERGAGLPVRRALLTVPADHVPGDPRRGWLIAAGEAAGFDVVELLPEPVAAAHAADAGPGLVPGGLVLGYDLGAGGCSVALLRIGETAPDVLGHARIPDCGGRDLDELLAERIGAQEWLSRPADPADADRLAHAITDFAQRVRHQLTDAEYADDHLLPDAPPYRLDRDTFAALAAPLLDRTVSGARDLLARLRVPAERLGTVLLTGGATRMPAVVTVLAEAFGRPLRRMEEPELATVRGAARWLLRTGPRRIEPLPVPGPPVPLAFGVPGGSARLLRWLVAPGAAYTVGDVLGRVRLPDGALWDLTASDDGTLHRILVPDGGTFAAGQWIALAYRQGVSARA